MNDNRQRHRPELDGIRGLAILAVLASHSGTVLPIFERTRTTRWFLSFLVPGWSGVDLFFVLSGFLITGILLRTKSSPNYYQSFYMRRFLRIFPIYYGTLIVLMVVGTQNAWLNERLPGTLWHRVSYFLYLQNLPQFPTPATIVGHFWSLAVEEQFYLVWPILVLRLSEKSLMRLCLAGYGVALPIRLVLVHYFGGSFRIMTFTTSRMDGLLLGALIAIVMLRRFVPLRWIASASVIAALLLIYISLKAPGEFLGTSVYMNTIGITAFALLSGSLVALSQHSIPRLRRVLSANGLRSFGKYSYGMYVYHLPIFLLAGKLCGGFLPLPAWKGALFTTALIMATYLIARFSFGIIEAPVLRLKSRFEARIPVPQEGQQARSRVV